MEKLNGPFKDIIPMFQKYKKSIGYKYDNINNYILIDKILEKNNIKNFQNSKEIFNILINKEEDINKQKRNYFALKELYNFMEILGYNTLYFEKKFYAYISKPTKPLTVEQIEEFFVILDQYCKNKNDTILPVIFRLIYSAGLRISEVINAKIEDLNMENGTLLIKKGKNNVTRMIGLSKSMLSILVQYFKINDLKNNKYLFEIKNKKINADDLESKFNKITSIIGVNSTVHALRFSFAVNTIDKLYQNNINSKEVLYPLSVYMGHKDIEDTEYYLQFTTEYQKKYVKNILPKEGNKNDV